MPVLQQVGDNGGVPVLLEEGGNLIADECCCLGCTPPPNITEIVVTLTGVANGPQQEPSPGVTWTMTGCASINRSYNVAVEPLGSIGLDGLQVFFDEDTAGVNPESPGFEAYDVDRLVSDGSTHETPLPDISIRASIQCNPDTGDYVAQVTVDFNQDVVVHFNKVGNAWNDLQGALQFDSKQFTGQFCVADAMTCSIAF